MTEWVITCNLKSYDVVSAFKKLDELEWKQSTNVEVGDMIYIYVGAPTSAIQYRCKAIAVNLPKGKIDDSEFIIDDSNYGNYGNYMRLCLLDTYNDDRLKYAALKKNGLKTVQGPSKITEEFSAYLNEINNSYKVEDQKEDDCLVTAVNNIELTDDMLFEYNGVKKKKSNPIHTNGSKIYRRDRQTAINALAHAQYLCEIDAKHPTFIRKRYNKNYTEPHHLVPMAYSDEFDVSLDVEENIVSLCSNCHNQIHYGVDADKLIKKLYEDRKDLLSNVGIDISVSRLLEMYGY